MKTTINQYRPQSVPHPGETLAEKLEEMGMSIKEFALRCSKPEKTIIAVIKGSSSITPDMSVAFENVTRIPALFWLKLQMGYDECQARNKKIAQLVSFNEWSKSFPTEAMAEFGWIPKCKTSEEKTATLLSFFAVNSPEAWKDYYISQQLKVAFRITLAKTKDPFAISAWLRQGEIQAADMQVEKEYDEKKLRELLPEMKDVMALAQDDVIERLQSLCLSCGVKLIFTPCLPKARISGATRWIGGSPCIQLCGRYSRYDLLWFTFFHEIGHILLHGKKDIFLENIEYDDLQKEKEAEADAFACRQLRISIEEMDLIKKSNRSTVGHIA